uniref:Uncharacterized protein n=1 Tax=Compsopogon caeruleus TaxID=31354 RepID=A0A7S1XDW5_9RHOD|mmetsp:Transcript_3701/g.7085  ORF Transcript_3701/g.7085 Transcript_3701/m.7085 type:complete len:278 (+) Transcript_3701:71-904(+)|eukprot:CAMPEP_0184678696 /NCGR_PEP_ID=MMETSP0312-20130426/1479_1 /TAXON_ID=31354 /ORGANISM="Compsopogon coeruleus, Strain SAG 36.94" /LENGTH=277 /DNA_ID=CAMNT_0027127627 /DNA_START=10 /DNA_END=843 /DNA_ORIENTATION=+
MVKFYSDQGKTAKKLLSDDFVADHKVSVKTKTASGVTFEVSEVQSCKTGDLAGEVSVKYLVFGHALTTKFGTGGVASTEATVEKPGKIDGLKVILNGSMSESSKAATAKAEYVKDRVAFTLFSDLMTKKFTSSVTVGHEGITLGGEASYDVASKEVKDYSGAISYTDGKEAEVSFSLLDKLQTAKVTYSHAVRPDLSFGAEFILKRGDSSKVLTIGTQYAVDKLTTLKGKINSSGLLSLAYIQRFPSNMTMKLSSTTNVNSLESSAPRIGVHLAYEA